MVLSLYNCSCASEDLFTIINHLAVFSVPFVFSIDWIPRIQCLSLCSRVPMWLVSIFSSLSHMNFSSIPLIVTIVVLSM